MCLLAPAGWTTTTMASSTCSSVRATEARAPPCSRITGMAPLARPPNAGLTSAGFGVNGAAWADYDNDGYPDLFFTAYPGGNLLYHNNGDGTFTRVTGSPLSTQHNTSWSCAWGDYDNDGFPDLFVTTGGGAGPQKNLLYHNEIGRAS